ncbi:hypothetical protein BHECKSOX2_776 [Bathymodiolus heckerae thiotrophic gill symbiont]|uniref:LPS assembly lipoprotein LptE n=1 Tax=Bathymodiolus heckerae thiotrophic gill symbiont TaxID=1052212 RepID=UPI0010BC7324|nr:LPS assembly lipoprotein LptE [Bathymodiolus heckerae thiotrophic gill symbiont]CAC9433865.1 hypothetical protein [uncultured Gammaproteobacteria bacterium]SMN13653.1 hypothetical protein BHECKSOX2_776 [Bathymodiolus heckerae thiotrophic gill symbiont]
MSKINLLSIILITSLLSACSFHTPNNAISINASITSSANNAFAAELKKHFNPQAQQSLRVEIGDEMQKQQTIAYKTNDDVSSYTLTLAIPVKVFRGKKLLLSKDLTASIIANKLSTQADRLQVNRSYTQLRSTIVKRLLRRLNSLNAH